MNVFTLIGAIISLVGVVLVYDARPIAKKMFSFGDRNEAAKSLKIVGFILSVIGGLLIVFNL